MCISLANLAASMRLFNVYCLLLFVMAAFMYVDMYFICIYIYFIFFITLSLLTLHRNPINFHSVRHFNSHLTFSHCNTAIYTQ